MRLPSPGLFSHDVNYYIVLVIKKRKENLFTVVQLNSKYIQNYSKYIQNYFVWNILLKSLHLKLSIFLMFLILSGSPFPVSWIININRLLVNPFYWMCIMHQSIPAAARPLQAHFGAFACLVSPSSGALHTVANFALPGDWAFTNPWATLELLTCTWFPIWIEGCQPPTSSDIENWQESDGRWCHNAQNMMSFVHKHMQKWCCWNCNIWPDW